MTGLPVPDKLPPLMQRRRDELELILAQLQQHSAQAISAGHGYALDETVRLIESLSSVSRYLDWFAHRLPQLLPDRLLELNELLPEWDEPIHRQLLHIERNRWPGFIRPIVNRLALEIAAAGRPITIVDLGAGSMEIERQVISRLRTQRLAVTFIGIDESASAHQHARDNLANSDTAIEIIQAPLDQALDLARRPADDFRVILCQASASAIAQLPHQSIDLLFHSFMRHHLTTTEQLALDASAAQVARRCLEYDGYHCRAHLIPLSILTWHHPGFLAASLFSHARFPTRPQLRARHNGRVKFFQNSCYLAHHDSRG